MVAQAIRAILLETATATSLAILGQQPHNPGMIVRLLPGVLNNGCCTDNEQPSEIAISLLGDVPGPLVVPLAAAPSTRIRPLLYSGSMAVAPITPIPGTVSRRQLISLAQ